MPGHIYNAMSFWRVVGTSCSPLRAKNQEKTAKTLISQVSSRLCPAEKADRENSNSAVVVDAINAAKEWVVAPSFQAFHLFSPMGRLREACSHYIPFQSGLHSWFHLHFSVSSALIKADSKKNLQTHQAISPSGWRNSSGKFNISVNELGRCFLGKTSVTRFQNWLGNK